MREMRKRFAILKKLIREAIVTEDGFGLTVNRTGRFNFTRTAEKHASFMEWLKRAEEENILQVRTGTPFRTAASRSWMNLYIDTAYKRGVQNSAKQIRGAGGTVTDRWIDAAFNRPIHADRVALIYTRTYNDLLGITDEMDKRISRALAEGLANGDGMMEIARSLEGLVDSVGRTRGELLARTEIISAHAEGTLNGFEEAGLEGVRLLAEFSTSQDNAVCPQCEELEGTVMSIEDARGIIPVHPNCRCAWLSVIEDGRDIVLA